MHENGLILNDCPQEIDESALEQLLIVAAPTIRALLLPLHYAHDVVHPLNHHNHCQPLKDNNAGLKVDGLFIREG